MNPTNRPLKLIFAGGGTGGHLYPAIAIADRIKEMLQGHQSVDILFVGTKRGIEYRIKDNLGYPLHLINVRGLVRSLTLKNLLVPFLFIGALIKAGALMKQFSPDIVIGTGGYVSLPVLRAAVSKKIKTVIQEQNSFPGIATRQLAAHAECVYLGFAEAKSMLSDSSHTVFTGNPVRSTISQGDRADAIKAFKLDPQKKTILILGGSQGARAINNAILHSSKTHAINNNYQLLWQTGKRDYSDVVATAGEAVGIHALFPFENRMPLVYAAADLVIARAGALTLAELEACELPAILIPYPYAAGDHQRKNAIAFVERGCAEVIEESELECDDLLSRAVALLESDRAQKMKAALHLSNQNRRPAVDLIAEDILSRIETTSRRQVVTGGAN